MSHLFVIVLFISFPLVVGGFYEDYDDLNAMLQSNSSNEQVMRRKLSSLEQLVDSTSFGQSDLRYLVNGLRERLDRWVKLKYESTSVATVLSTSTSTRPSVQFTQITPSSSTTTVLSPPSSTPTPTIAILPSSTTPSVSPFSVSLSPDSVKRVPSTTITNLSTINTAQSTFPTFILVIILLFVILIFVLVFGTFIYHFIVKVRPPKSLFIEAAPKSHSSTSLSFSISDDENF